MTLAGTSVSAQTLFIGADYVPSRHAGGVTYLSTAEAAASFLTALPSQALRPDWREAVLANGGNPVFTGEDTTDPSNPGYRNRFTWGGAVTGRMNPGDFAAGGLIMSPPDISGYGNPDAIWRKTGFGIQRFVFDTPIDAFGVHMHAEFNPFIWVGNSLAPVLFEVWSSGILRNSFTVLPFVVDPTDDTYEYYLPLFVGYTGGGDAFDEVRIRAIWNDAGIMGPPTIAATAVSVVPEPATWALLGAGLLVMGGLVRRRMA